MKLSHISYQNRFSASSLLVSKATRLTDVSSSEELSSKQRKAIRKGVDFYEMALLLMKPFDPNYSTIKNWRCLALIKLGRFKEAVSGYEEILNISEKTNGKHTPCATAKLANDQIKKYSAYEDIPYDDNDSSDSDLFDDPPYCRFADEFCSLLVNGKFKKAYSMMSESAKSVLPEKKLKSLWRSMIGGEDIPDLNLLEYMTEWPSREENQIGWCYFSVSNDLKDEAIAVVVAITKYNTYEITKIELGRP